MRLAFVSDNIESNSLGRVYSLWLLAQELGYKSRIFHSRGGTTWGPLRDSSFAADIADSSTFDAPPPWTDWEPDLLVPVKCLPSSYGQALRWNSDSRLPILLDVDDPDAESMLAIDQPVKRAAKRLLRFREMREVAALRRRAPSEHVMVSSPVLARYYGGTVVPHVRHDAGAGPDPVSPEPRIAFVGTNRSHKGTPVLREAVTECKHLGYRLVITDHAPDDRRPWECWIGPTSLDDGLKLVARSDLVVIPSLISTMSAGQLPAKLIDAMILGRPVIASDLPAIRWALGPDGRYFEPGSAEGLARQLVELADPELRRQLGRRLRARALQMFTPEMVAPAFRDACQAALRQSSSR